MRKSNDPTAELIKQNTPLREALALQSRFETLAEQSITLDLADIRQNDEFAWQVVDPLTARDVVKMSHWFAQGWRVDDKHPLNALPNIWLVMPRAQYDEMQNRARNFYRELVGRVEGVPQTPIGADGRIVTTEMPENQLTGAISLGQTYGINELGAHLPEEGGGILGDAGYTPGEMEPNPQ